MKIKLNLLVLICAVLFVACTNGGNVTGENSATDVNSSKINAVLFMKDYAEQKVEYLLLNQEEKFVIWNNKMNSLLNSNKLNNNQKQLVQELLDNIKPNFFDKKSNDEKEYFKNIFVKNFLLKIDKNFSRKQIYTLFYSVTVDESSSNSSETAIYAARINCDCNKGSLFGCGADDGCKISGCEDPTTSGCGFMWGWECNGGCINYL